MPKWLEKTLKTLFYAACITCGSILVLLCPPLAIGFLAAGVVSLARTPHEAVLLGALASVLGGILIANVAELAMLGTGLSIAQGAQEWQTAVVTA